MESCWPPPAGTTSCGSGLCDKQPLAVAAPGRGRLTLLPAKPSSPQIEPEEVNQMQRRTMFWMATAALAVAAPLVAGGFYLQLGNPEANPKAQKMNAVLVIKATGCHDPASATITGKAIGVVSGQRR